MAGEAIFKKGFKKSLGLVAALIVISSCTIEPIGVPDSSFTQTDVNLSPYIQSLALINSSLDDFEGNISGINGTSCKRTYDCSGASPKFTTDYASCATSEDSTLNGSYDVVFGSQQNCLNNFAQADYVGTHLVTRTIPLSFQKIFKGSLVSVTSGGTFMGTYVSGANNELSLNGLSIKSEGLFDLLIRSDLNLAYTGRRSLGTRHLLYGRFSVRDAVSSKTFELNFSELQWTEAQCCYPTRGTINAVVIGRGNETLSIRSCGVADFTDLNGSKRSVSLTGACR